MGEMCFKRNGAPPGRPSPSPIPTCNAQIYPALGPRTGTNQYDCVDKTFAFNRRDDNAVVFTTHHSSAAVNFSTSIQIAPVPTEL